jgi:hypothetical protein
MIKNCSTRARHGGRHLSSQLLWRHREEGITVWSKSTSSYPKITKAEKVWGCGSSGKHLPSKCGVLNSNPNTNTKKKRKSNQPKQN